MILDTICRSIKFSFVVPLLPHWEANVTVRQLHFTKVNKPLSTVFPFLVLNPKFFLTLLLRRFGIWYSALHSIFLHLALAKKTTLAQFTDRATGSNKHFRNVPCWITIHSLLADIHCLIQTHPFKLNIYFFPKW